MNKIKNNTNAREFKIDSSKNAANYKPTAGNVVMLKVKEIAKHQPIQGANIFPNRIKKSIITKSVEEFKIDSSKNISHKPVAGDVALFKVKEIGKHKAIQGEKGTNYHIFEGDLILCCFGARYASEQFEGYVPDGYRETYDLLGQGGVIGELESMHTKFDDIGTTKVELVGYAISENGKVINTIKAYQEKTPKPTKLSTKTKIYLSVGASMDSGKTTTAAFFCRGSLMAGKKAGYIKLTGTVYAKDCRIARDCGALTAVDFSCCGYPSTYLTDINEIKEILYALLERANRIQLDHVIIEIADGLFQNETNQLLSDIEFKQLINGGVFLSCGDSLAIKCGIDFLTKKGLKPMVLSGLFTASPLMIEEVKSLTNIPIYSIEDFVIPEKLNALLS